MWQTLNFRRHVQKATKKIYTEKPYGWPPAPPRVPDLVCKITKRKTQKVKHGIVSIFWQRFRAPRDLSIAGWDQEKKSEGDFFLYSGEPKKKKTFSFPLFILTPTS